MCRLLYVRSQSPFQVVKYLEHFARISKESKEYQGHGWGLSLWDGSGWLHQHSINPIWEDHHQRFPQARVLLAHARSAFRDEGVVVENNMPFHDESYSFAFNGELRGVRLPQPGKIGAEKIFNVIRASEGRDTREKIERAVRIIRSRTRYIRALNFIIAQGQQAFLYSQFGEDPEYFTLNISKGEQIVVCSQSFPIPGQNWEPVKTERVEVI